MKLSPSIPSLFSSVGTREVSLVLHIDVGDGNSRAALVREGNQSNPEMIFTAARNEKISKNAHSKNLSVTLSSIRELLEDVKKFIVKESHVGNRIRITSIYGILGAPYYLSHTALIKYKEPKGFVVTPDLISRLLRSYRKSTDPEYETHKEAEVGEAPVTVAERLLHIKINGYHTAKPYGKRATSLDLSVFKTEAASEVVMGVEREVKKFFSTPVQFEPLSLAIYVALRDRVHFDPDFLFVVVGPEVTEMSLIRGYSLLETVSFPFGKHSLVRRLSRDLKSPEEMTAASLALFNLGTVNVAEKERIGGALQSAREKWFPFFEQALVSLSDETAVPSSVYLVSDQDTESVFKRFIETDSFAGQSLVPNGFSVSAIDVEKAKSLMHFGPEATCDTLLCLEGLFALSTKLPILKKED